MFSLDPRCQSLLASAKSTLSMNTEAIQLRRERHIWHAVRLALTRFSTAIGPVPT